MALWRPWFQDNPTATQSPPTDQGLRRDEEVVNSATCPPATNPTINSNVNGQVLDFSHIFTAVSENCGSNNPVAGSKEISTKTGTVNSCTALIQKPESFVVALGLPQLYWNKDTGHTTVTLDPAETLQITRTSSTSGNWTDLTKKHNIKGCRVLVSRLSVAQIKGSCTKQATKSVTKSLHLSSTTPSSRPRTFEKRMPKVSPSKNMETLRKGRGSQKGDSSGTPGRIIRRRQEVTPYERPQSSSFVTGWNNANNSGVFNGVLQAWNNVDPLGGGNLVVTGSEVTGNKKATPKGKRGRPCKSSSPNNKTAQPACIPSLPDSTSSSSDDDASLFEAVIRRVQKTKNADTTRPNNGGIQSVDLETEPLDYCDNQVSSSSTSDSEHGSWEDEFLQSEFVNDIVSNALSDAFFPDVSFIQEYTGLDPDSPYINGETGPPDVSSTAPSSPFALYSIYEECYKQDILLINAEDEELPMPPEPPVQSAATSSTTMLKSKWNRS